MSNEPLFLYSDGDNPSEIQAQQAKVGEDAFHEVLDTAPFDREVRRQYATWLDGEGRGHEAKIQRWMTNGNAMPSPRLGSHWGWSRNEFKGRKHTGIWNAISERIQSPAGQKLFHSRRDAETALYNAVHDLEKHGSSFID